MRMIVVKNDTKHEWVCKLVTEIKDRAMYFPNSPRTILYAGTEAVRLSTMAYK